MVKVSPEIIDKLAELEVSALLDGLNDPDLRKNPAFLEKVRKFLSQNHLEVTQETPGIKRIQAITEELPTFNNEVITN